ncbi:MAG: dTMP kinase [Hyphomicrobiaceae bacterium]
MARGRFITFEGGEGTGKTTQAERLALSLRGQGRDVVVTREPGGSPFAEAVRSILLDPRTPPHSPLAEALLFYAARADHLEKTIRPALERGQWVICDRFSDSTRVYQGVTGGLGSEAIEILEHLVVNLTTPDLTILLDLDAAVGLARAEQRRVAAAPGSVADADRYEARRQDYHERLRQAFLDIARSDPRRCVIVEAGRSADDIARDVAAHVAARLARGG